MEDKKKLARRIDKLCSPLMLKFFFCYSDEMKEDVDKAELELRRYGDLHKGNVTIETKTWRTYGIIDNHYSKKKLQDVYDEEIVKCDYVIFLFYNYFGENTMHEWRLCRDNLKRKPKILLGIKHDNCSEKSLQEIRGKLESGNRIVDVEYEKIETFIDAINKEIGIRLNKRLTDIKKVLREEVRNVQITPEQISKLEREQERINSIIRQSPVSRHEFNISKMVTEVKHVELSCGKLSELKKIECELSPRSAVSGKGHKF